MPVQYATEFVVKKILKKLHRRSFYLLFNALSQGFLLFSTPPKKCRVERPWIEKILLRKRTVIESIFHILKNTFEIEHTRHRSVANTFVHFVSTLLAYCFKTNKPAIKYSYLIQN